MLTDEKVITGIYNKLKSLINKSATINLEIGGDDTNEDITYKFSEFLDSDGFTKDLVLCINETMFYNLRKDYYNNNMSFIIGTSKNLYNIEEIDGKPALYKHYIEIFDGTGTSYPIRIHLGRSLVKMLD